jgi:hypothetical protein
MSKQRKTYTSTQIAGRQAKAIRMARDIRGDDDRAAELEAMTPEDYAQERGLLIQNPTTHRSKAMPQKTIDADELEDLEDDAADAGDATDALAEVWELVAPLDGNSLKSELVSAVDEITSIINKYDPDRFVIEGDDDDEEEDEE